MGKHDAPVRCVEYSYAAGHLILISFTQQNSVAFVLFCFVLLLLDNIFCTYNDFTFQVVQLLHFRMPCHLACILHNVPLLFIFCVSKSKFAVTLIASKYSIAPLMMPDFSIFQIYFSYDLPHKKL